MSKEDFSIKRRALEPAVDNRAVIDMDELKQFITDQNKELQDTISLNLQQTIKNNNTANIQSLERILKEKLDSFAGYVDSKINVVRDDCEASIKVLSDGMTDKINKFNDDTEDRLERERERDKSSSATNGIKSTFRLSRNQNKSNPIIMKFYDLADKRDFMFAYFKNQKLNLTDLGFKTQLRIVICEALTRKNNDIFKKAMELKFSKIFSSVSTKNGFVYYRLDQKSRPKFHHYNR